MNLYYWDDVSALENYSTGYAFALAETKEQAIYLIRKKLFDYHVDYCGLDWVNNDELNYFNNKFDSLVEELNTKQPKTFSNESVGFIIFGSY